MCESHCQILSVSGTPIHHPSTPLHLVEGVQGGQDYYSIFLRCLGMEQWKAGRYFQEHLEKMQDKVRKEGREGEEGGREGGRGRGSVREGGREEGGCEGGREEGGGGGRDGWIGRKKERAYNVTVSLQMYLHCLLFWRDVQEYKSLFLRASFSPCAVEMKAKVCQHLSP